VFTQPDSALGDLIREEMSARGGVSISSSSDVLSPAEKSDVFARSVDFESLRMRAGRWTGVDAVPLPAMLMLLCSLSHKHAIGFSLETHPLFHFC
jgi:hypothetical protein